MIVLGDLNVAQEGGAYGEIQAWGIYNDRDNDGRPDFYHAAGSVEDTEYTGQVNSDIDHILISDELKDAWSVVPASQRNAYLNTTVSDHAPVKTTLSISGSD
ncbi:hypothetical protein CHH28_16730 [Bacterioplanes sanyensis]|uniref:Endonuclease/exonuclease/phosphatase domain-containing protein n=1 Tax=Bacterioplanes sanyensis TaxID=1249553 RepID=A0A222FN56_9GAMM|nr:hypothetical protein CHH28_16730 [Bacterioplanes sanyensis]